MARAYSLDLRERVVAAIEAGQSCRSVELDLPLIPVQSELIAIDPAGDPIEPSDLSRISASQSER